jgi:hypothetical protein
MQYFQLQLGALWDNVRNGGPPFILHRDCFVSWIQGAKGYCPLLLYAVIEIIQPHADPHRREPISKKELHSHLRVHMAAMLSASPETSRMTVEAGFGRLHGNAKTFAQDSVLDDLESFVDRSICKYLADELMRVSEQLEQVRGQQRLANECCEDVLSREDYTESR